MCGRYALRTSVPALARTLGVELPANLAPRYNIAPTQPVAVLRAAAGRRSFAMLRWGLVPSWSAGPDARYAMHNARREGLADKPAYRTPLRRRRCLIPADGWYEWQKLGARKQPWLIELPDSRPFCFAGLWDAWERDGATIESCTIITAPADPGIAHLHPRMPLIAPPPIWDGWLDPQQVDAAQALALLEQAPCPGLTTTAVSTHLNNARNDDPRCVEPI
jgi:putative SOS response-associated peptidase YedK